MSLDSVSSLKTTAPVSRGVFPRRALTMGEAPADDSHTYTLTVYLNAFNPTCSDERLRVDFHKRSTTEELIEKILEQAKNVGTMNTEEFDIFEAMGTLDGKTFKERKLDRGEYPVAVQNLWPRQAPAIIAEEEPLSVPRNRFVMRRKTLHGDQASYVNAASSIDSFLAKFLQQPQNREYADLCNLPELTEQTLLDNLRDRFNSGHIYTYIGPILVAVNPFRFFPIYNPKYSSLYCQSRRLGTLPPHIFALADVTYHNMLRIRENQCVVISGESGSGKTESTNFLLHHLTTLSQKGGIGGCTIEQVLLSAGPVLEAFGNAVTVQNNNSSRFGKFIKINYREHGMVSGANVEIYLLEKSRIISQAVGERNYHVFYYLLDGASEEERRDYFLLHQKDYHYLRQSTLLASEVAANEKHELERLKHSMESVGFSANSQQKIFGIVSAVLLLGNVEFVERQAYHSDENAYVSNEELVDVVAQLLHISPQQLHLVLTIRKTVLKNDTVITRHNLAEAVNTRDAMAKCLYNAVFHWIVLRINQCLIRREATMSKKGYYIAVLDIFGFEDVGVQWNSFEQLCINYANEHLQAYFNQHIFQFEQEEYLKKGIEWTNIEYTDNTECVQLFQSKPYGLLRLVDEESNINNGTDKSMLEKLNKFLKSNEYYEIPHKREDAFIVAHYAGKVKYQIAGFREKNKDLMRQDVMAVLKGSKSAFIRELVGDDPVAVYRWTLLRNTLRAIFAFKYARLRPTKRSGSVDRPAASGDLSRSLSRHSSDSQLPRLNAFLKGELNESIVPDFCDTSVFETIVRRARQTPTKQIIERHSYLRSLQAVKQMIGKRPVTNKPSSVIRQFDYSLSRLMKTLAQATPYFIRCIKSNNEKIPNYFDDNIILRQLRYTGMLETVRIRRAGYSVRFEYDSFVSQYRILLPKGIASTRDDIEEFILLHPIIDNNNVQYGKTKIFMRDAEKLLLDDHLHRVIISHIITLQRHFRCLLARRQFLRLRNGIIKLQALTRGIIARNEVRHRFLAAEHIQSRWRGWTARRHYLLVRETILRIQAAARSHFQRQKLDQIRSAHEALKKSVPVIPFGKMARVETIALSKFDLNNPASLAMFGGDDRHLDSDGESSSCSSSSSFTSIEEDVFLDDLPSKQALTDLDAKFILEDTRLKENDKHVQRRQSLATTASTTKLRMLRRAASTESDQLQRSEITGLKKKSTYKMGFSKAKKQLKSLMTRHQDNTISLEDEISEGGKYSAALDAGDRSNKHNLKMTRIYKGDICAFCSRTLTGILVQSYKCLNCKLSFHKECSSFTANIPCSSPIVSPARLDSGTLVKRPWDVIGFRTPRQSISLGPTVAPKLPFHFNLTKTKQQKDSSAFLIESTDDLRQFSVFIFKKQSNLEHEKKNQRETVVDAVFKRSLREFHMELIGMEAVLREEKAMLKYRDLIATFEGLLTKKCNEENVVFPTTLGVNAFRGFLNEFMQQRIKRKSSSMKSTLIKNVRKKRRRSDVTVYNSHRFRVEYVHVPTYCEICNQFMWLSEKIFICVNCRLSCHKKCYNKITYVCAKAARNNLPVSGDFFGSDLASLVNEDQDLPVLLDKLLITIEVKALFVEGIYRKSGSLATIRTIRKIIETMEDPGIINFDDVPVHVLTTLVKTFFRELAEPLIVEELYENFVNVSEIKEINERTRCLKVMVDLLPKANRCVLDRLMYHLARIAHQESVNRMNAANLSVIFAPCILRRSSSVHAQDQLMDVQKQAICVQALIEEKLRQYCDTLYQIIELEDASEKVSENLRLIEEHRRSSESSTMSVVEEGSITPAAETANEPTPTPETNSRNIETAKLLFEEQLHFLDKEKTKLIQELPPLAICPVASSEDLSSSDFNSSADADGTPTPTPTAKTKSSSSGSASLHNYEEYAIDMRRPPILCRLPNSFWRLKSNRRRMPSKAFFLLWKQSF